MKKRKFKHPKMEHENKAQDPEIFNDVFAEDAETAEVNDVEPEAGNETDPAAALEKELDETKAALEKEKKEYLFLMAEFDNFKKRTLKEKAELIKNGAESAMKGILPIVDDFERGLQAITDTEGAESVKEGMVLIYNKFVKYLEQNGVKAMESTGTDFDDRFHEAVALVPGPEEQKGKVIDTLQKGYTINDKVIRHAKVAVGQ
ncbi:MAG: nucleotide exchange factor GrpE [Bacteroides sp.]|nr:nucleotide exchange factor GrpE [Bacteroidales bacterium]MBD5188255.1 nucleotide exchange factor GrpE [Bacteroidales bacterium]MBD5415424.1 nucleotide exchange factor GrpE [Bacteroides sp.]